MGLGIALVAARVSVLAALPSRPELELTDPPLQTAKVEVLLADNSEVQLAKGLKFAETLLAKDVSKGKLSQEDADAARSRLKTVKGIEAFGEVDIAIEAVSESLPLKEKIFASLANTLPAGAILASNTSSISLSKIAAACGPERASHCVGFHFCEFSVSFLYTLCPPVVHPSRGSLEVVILVAEAQLTLSPLTVNPVPVMKLVELIPALQTSPEVLARARAFAEAMGKTVTVSQDSPGSSLSGSRMSYKS